MKKFAFVASFLLAICSTGSVGAAMFMATITVVITAGVFMAAEKYSTARLTTKLNVWR